MRYTDTTTDGLSHASQEASASSAQGQVRTHTPLQAHFLLRLQQLSDLRQRVEHSPVQDPFTRKLLGRGIFATYHECLDSGVGDEAREILQIA